MSTATIADNKTIIAAFFERLNEGALDGSEDWAAYLSPAGDRPQQDHLRRGRRARRRHRGLPAGNWPRSARPTPPESGLLVQELIGEGDLVVARLRVVGKHTGSHPRMPEPTGRDCDVEQIWIFTLTDGLITEIRAVSDRLGMFLQLGWDWPTAG